MLEPPSSRIGPAAAPSPEVLPGRRPAARRALVAGLLGLLGGGVVLGLAWHVLLPEAARVSEAGEAEAASDVSFALLSVLAGLITAGALWSSRRVLTATRLLLVVLGCELACLVAVGTAAALGPVRIRAWAVVLVWPLTTSLLTAVAAIAQTIFAPED